MLNNKRYLDTYFYDAESFPTFACITFLSDTDGSVFQFKFGLGYDDGEQLKTFLERKVLLVGFNSISYDNPVTRFILAQTNNQLLPSLVFALSQRLVNDEHRKDDDIRELRYPRNTFYQWDFLDLFKIMHFDRLGVGLKQVAVNLMHEKIQDLPYNYDYPISTPEEVAEVLKYNVNDVVITKKLYYKVQDVIKLREEIGQIYNVDVMNASDSKMGNIILEHYYQNELGIDVNSLRDLRTKRTSVNLVDCIPDVISFQTPALQELHDSIKRTTVFSFDNYKFEHTVKYNQTSYSIGSGGIHSMEKNVRFDSTAEKKIISCDIGSMYPTCIILNNIYPEHLDDNFVKVLSIITGERLTAKKLGHKVKAEGLKITINGLYGKLNSDTFWLEDAFAMLRVTIAGQLYILMLIEMLELQGIPCISANTDGIECEVPVELESVYYDVCKQWEERTGFSLEFVQYKSYIKRDVNNYIAIDTTDKVKTKGAFIPSIDLKKGYKHPIVPFAVYKYFSEGIPVEKTIESCTDIFQFCISQKSGKEFKMQLLAPSGLKSLQKTNRFYIAHYGGYLQKKHVEDGRVIGLFVGNPVQILNDYDANRPFEMYGVNKSWYIKEAKSLVEEIEPPQYSLFNMRGDFGTYRNMNGEIVTKKKKKSNPLSKKITDEEVRSADRKKIIYDTDSTYALVTELRTDFSPAFTLYYFVKGSKAKFKVNKKLFAQQPFTTQDILAVNAIEKKPKVVKEGDEFVEIPNQYVYWITKYRIVKDISDFKRKETI